MCARYTVFTEDEIIRMREIIKEVERKLSHGNKIPNREIRPSDMAPVLVREGPAPVRWGFPSPQSSGMIINARSETYLQKPTFIRCVPCLVPATAFFEWGTEEEQLALIGEPVRSAGKKKKYMFSVINAPMFYMAGLMREYHEEARFVIMTTDAEGNVREIHDRMPVILTDDGADHWLMHGNLNRSEAQLMRKAV